MTQSTTPAQPLGKLNVFTDGQVILKNDVNKRTDLALIDPSGDIKKMLSTTILNPVNSTKNQSYDTESVYIFLNTPPSGGVVMQVGDKQQDAHNGDIFYVPPNTSHRVINSSPDKVAFWCILDGPFSSGSPL